MNMQIVLCKGINDGAELDRTLSDLSRFIPYASSVSVVPVGLTRCREGLYPLAPFEKEDAQNVIAQISAWQEKFLKEHGTRFVYASDEFFVTAELPVPDEEEYEDFPQIENGVGMLASLEAEFQKALDLGLPMVSFEKTVVATGEISYEFIKKLVNTAKMRYNRIDTEVIKVPNQLFGGKVTVSGLLGGGDLIRALKGTDATRVFITKSMLKADEDIFLDDYTLKEVEQEIGAKVIPVQNDGEAFLRAILGESERTNQ